MPKLPQVNIRLAPEHHDLIRQLAQRLRANPSLAVGLADFIAQASESEPTQVSPLTHGLAGDVAELLHAFQERLTIQSESLRTTMAFAESISERVKVLEERPVGTLEPTPEPTPALEKARNRPIPIEHIVEAARLWDGGRGPSFKAIRDKKGWPHNFNALNKAVNKYLERTGGDRPQEDAQDEQETRPHE